MARVYKLSKSASKTVLHYGIVAAVLFLLTPPVFAVVLLLILAIILIAFPGACGLVLFTILRNWKNREFYSR